MPSDWRDRAEEILELIREGLLDAYEASPSYIIDDLLDVIRLLDERIAELEGKG